MTNPTLNVCDASPEAANCLCFSVVVFLDDPLGFVSLRFLKDGILGIVSLWFLKTGAFETGMTGTLGTVKVVAF
jgi:hypothetical protein